MASTENKEGGLIIPLDVSQTTSNQAQPSQQEPLLASLENGNRTVARERENELVQKIEPSQELVSGSASGAKESPITSINNPSESSHLLSLPHEQQSQTEKSEPESATDMKTESDLKVEQQQQQQQQPPQPPSSPPQQPPQEQQVPTPSAESAKILDNDPSSIGAPGPSSSDTPTSPISPSKEDDSGPVLFLNLLLISGAKHPFKIDGKYLRKREVSVPDHDPYRISVYTLKELIWREWRSGMIGKLARHPPALYDLYHSGEYCRFNHEAPNIVHMTVRPQEIVDEEDAKAAKSSHGRDREDSESSPSCRCIIF
ncbi:hypothetical protein FQN57_002043 [Myotisia sp. PD_48]|nr:hypothetical protein FQN57_002043 [Myotisia sp. PD_48]